jgi:hypothetical protein
VSTTTRRTVDSASKILRRHERHGTVIDGFVATLLSKVYYCYIEWSSKSVSPWSVSERHGLIYAFCLALFMNCSQVELMSVSELPSGGRITNRANKSQRRVQTKGVRQLSDCPRIRSEFTPRRRVPYFSAHLRRAVYVYHGVDIVIIVCLSALRARISSEEESQRREKRGGCKRVDVIQKRQRRARGSKYGNFHAMRSMSDEIRDLRRRPTSRQRIYSVQYRRRTDVLCLCDQVCDVVRPTVSSTAAWRTRSHVLVSCRFGTHTGRQAHRGTVSTMGNKTEGTVSMMSLFAEGRACFQERRNP